MTGLQWIVDAYVLLVAMLLLSGGVFAGPASLAGLDSAFIVAGAVTLASAVFTGLWLVKSTEASASVEPVRSG